jgi:hypothetical protein
MPGCGRFSAAGRGTSRASKRDMRSYQIRLAVSLVVFIAAAAVLAPSAATQSNQPAERFTAFAVSTGGARGGAVASTVQITIDRWSTDADRQRLIDTLQSKGPEALLDTLRDTRQVGNIRTPDSLGYPLHYAHQRPLEDGGRQIVIATDRRISFWEAVNRPRTIDYPFTLIQLQIKPDGTGEGKMSVATRIIAHDNIIELEDYNTQPVMLNQVKAEKK